MTESAVVAARAASGAGSLAASLLRRPLWQHALALLGLLTVLAAYTGTRSAFVTDESFVVIQLEQIEDTGEWTVPHPLPEVDPEGSAFPLHGSSRFEDGYILYGKHPLLIYLYLPVHRAFGLPGLVGLSVIGTAGAALAAGALAERVRAGAGALALWLVGAGSPLLFDAFLIHAHTIAAALAAVAAYLALRAVEENRWAVGLGALPALYGVALLRTEGVLFAGALGASIGLMGLLRRRAPLVLLWVGGLAAGAAAFLTDREWSQRLTDSAAVALERYPQHDASFLSDRVGSVWITTLLPGYTDLDLAQVATMLGAVLLVLGALLIRRRPQDEGALLLLVVGAGLLLVRAAMGWGPVPGIALAFCVGATGLALLRGAVWRAVPTRLLLLCSGVYAIAVVLTQYKSGGHTEWGGRYFSLAVPLVGAVAAASLCRAFASLPPRRARALKASLLVASVGLGALAVNTVARTHDRNRQRSDAVLSAASLMPPAPDGEPPVVVTEDDQIPRLARERFFEARFLNVPPAYVGRYLKRLADEGFDDVLLVSLDPAKSLQEIPTAYEPVGSVLPHALQWEDGGGLIHLQRVNGR